MIDLRLISGFQWDAGNALKNVEKHGVAQSEAEQIFLNEPLIVLHDPGHSDREPRFHALGQTDDGRLLHVAFTLQGGGAVLRVISARDMRRRERRRYGEET